MIGRHGVEMVTRGIAAVDALQSYAFSGPWATPKLLFRDERARLLEIINRRASESPSLPPVNPTSGLDAGQTHPRLNLREVSVDRGLMGALLEAIATGGAEFCVKPHETLVVKRSVKDDNGGASLTTNAVDVDGGGDGEAKSSLSSTTTTAGTGEDRRQRGSASRGMGLDTDRSPDPDKRLDINRAAGDQARIDGDVGRSVAAPQGEENHVGKLNPFKYRTFSRVDSSIMSSIATDIKPTWPTRSSGGGAGRTTHYMPARDAPRHITGGSVSRARGKRSDGGDVKIVIGPEIEWGLDTPDGQERITMKSVVEPLRAAGENGISLAELRKALRGLGNAGNGVHEEDNVLLAGLGHALRVGEVVCVCSAENIR